MISPEQSSPLMGDLQAAVNSARKGIGGGIIALIGKTGSGKSVLARQLTRAFQKATYYDGIHQRPNLNHDDPSAVVVLDSVHLIPGVHDVIHQYVAVKRRVVIVIGMHISDAVAACGKLPFTVLEVPHFGSIQSTAIPK